MTALHPRTVHIWDGGLLHRWFSVEPKGAAGRFLSHVEEQSQDFDAVVVALDGPGETWRHRLFPGYKSGMPTMGPVAAEFYEQQVRRVYGRVKAWRASRVYRLPGVEADDVVASAATLARSAGWSVTVTSGDKDLVQLMGPRLELRDGRAVVTRQGVKERFGVEPEQMVDFLAIVGDAADCYPGVKGLGPVAAAELLGRFGSLDAALDQLPERAKWYKLTSAEQKLLDDAAMAKMCQALARLDDSVALPVPQAKAARRVERNG